MSIDTTYNLINKRSPQDIEDRMQAQERAWSKAVSEVRVKVEAFIESCDEPVSYRQIKEAVGDSSHLTSAVISEKIIRIPGLYDRFIWHTKEAPKSSWLPLESDRYSRKHYRHAHQVMG